MDILEVYGGNNVRHTEIQNRVIITLQMGFQTFSMDSYLPTLELGLKMAPQLEPNGPNWPEREWYVWMAPSAPPYNSFSFISVLFAGS